MTESIQVDQSRTVVALGAFRLSVEQRGELMQELGMSQLVSVRRTFRERGSPAGSWVPLAASTIRRNPKIYGAGHKLLIRSGRLLNSIGIAQTSPTEVVLSTNVVYAAVHQFGSRDRHAAIGPKSATEAAATVDVGGSSYFRLSSELGTGKLAGRKRRIQGPRNARQVNVRGHSRHQNIPPRPYLVFRPEDPARLASIAGAYVNKAAAAAGLGGGE
jgi:phage gpG-like protein